MHGVGNEQTSRCPQGFLTPITATQEFSAENSFRRPQATSGALQSMNDAISGLSHEAEELRQAIADGALIVELDANDIDASFVQDRIEDFDSSAFEALLESIRDNGQAVPVLVRPYPDRAGRYQIAYGHRRVAALKKLGQRSKRSFVSCPMINWLLRRVTRTWSARTLLSSRRHSLRCALKTEARHALSSCRPLGQLPKVFCQK